MKEAVLQVHQISNLICFLFCSANAIMIAMDLRTIDDDPNS